MISIMGKKQKILHLLTSLEAGGAETNLLALLRNFDKDKFVHAVAYGGQGGVLEKEFLELGVNLIRIYPKSLNISSLFHIKKIVHEVKCFSPDIIHTHLDLPNIIGLISSKILKCYLIIHFHGLAMVPHKLLPDRPMLRSKLWNFVSRFYKYCDKAIAICEYQRPFLLRIGFKNKQIKLISNGVNLDVVPSKNLNENYTFVNIGRFHPDKNHSILIDAFRDVLLKIPSAKLNLVGDGGLLQSMKEKVENLGIGDNVKFLGLRRDIPVILSNSDCFVLSSRWELQPITILEAMRAGLPVISSNVGGISDTVENERTGLLVEPGNRQALTSAMIDMASNIEQSNIMGANGEERVKQHFNNKNIAHEIEDVYEDILSVE